MQVESYMFGAHRSSFQLAFSNRLSLYNKLHSILATVSHSRYVGGHLYLTAMVTAAVQETVPVVASFFMYDGPPFAEIQAVMPATDNGETIAVLVTKEDPIFDAFNNKIAVLLAVQENQSIAGVGTRYAESMFSFEVTKDEAKQVTDALRAFQQKRAAGAMGGRATSFRDAPV